MVVVGGCFLGLIFINIYLMDLIYGLMFGVGVSMCYFLFVVILG